MTFSTIFIAACGRAQYEASQQTLTDLEMKWSETGSYRQLARQSKRGGRRARFAR